MHKSWEKFRDEVIGILNDSGKYNSVKEFDEDRIRIKTKDEKDFSLRIGEFNPEWL